MGSRDSERLAELVSLACGTIDPETLASFLCTPEPYLEGHCPLDVIRWHDEGAFCRVKARLRILCQPANQSVLPG